jgi:hypothetical protein
MHPHHIMFGFLSSPEFMLLGALFLPGVVFAVPAHAVLSRTPPEFRRLRPQQAWLLMIPLLWLITNFLVHPKVAPSVADYARQRGKDQFGEGAATLARMFSICVVAAIIFGPLRVLGFGFLALGLVLLVVFYARLFSMTNKLAQPGAPPNGGPATPGDNSRVTEGPPSVS